MKREVAFQLRGFPFYTSPLATRFQPQLRLVMPEITVTLAINLSHLRLNIIRYVFLRESPGLSWAENVKLQPALSPKAALLNHLIELACPRIRRNNSLYTAYAL